MTMVIIHIRNAPAATIAVRESLTSAKVNRGFEINKVIVYNMRSWLCWVSKSQYTNKHSKTNDCKNYYKASKIDCVKTVA